MFRKHQHLAGGIPTPFWRAYLPLQSLPLLRCNAQLHFSTSPPAPPYCARYAAESFFMDIIIINVNLDLYLPDIVLIDL